MHSKVETNGAAKNRPGDQQDQVFDDHIEDVA
jgi:hypothetical protein